MNNVEHNMKFNVSQVFCYVFYACVGLMVILLHISGLLSDPESLPMLIIIGWPVSAPIILFLLVIPWIKVTKITFSKENNDDLLKFWFWINIAFWILFITNVFPLFRLLLLESALAKSLSYIYAALTVFLPGFKYVLPRVTYQVTAVAICLFLACTTLFFHDFQQDRFSFPKSLSDQSILMHKAIDNGDLEEVKRLVKAGADIAAKDVYGWDALLHAVYFQRPDIVEFLIAQGANPNTRENKSGLKKLDPNGITGQSMVGRSAIEYAAARHYPTHILRALLESGADPNTVNVNDGWTPLAAARFPDTAKLLISFGADVNYINPDEHGRQDSILIHAARHQNRSKVVRVLLEAGADPGYRNRNGKTALMLAKDDETRTVLESFRPKMP